MKALYPGSFDPLTLGHMDVITRAARLAEDLVVAVGVNSAKTPMWDAEARVEMIRRATRGLSNVRVVEMDTTVAQAVVDYQRDCIIKGVRDTNDLSSEVTQATINRDLCGVETFFLPTRGELAHVSSTMVRELLRWKLDVSRYVPHEVLAFIQDNRS